MWDATYMHGHTLQEQHISLHLGLQEVRQENRRLRNETCIPSFLLNICFVHSQSRLETLGTFGEEALKLTRELGQRLRNATGDSDSEMRLGTAGRRHFFIFFIFLSIRRI